MADSEMFDKARRKQITRAWADLQEQIEAGVVTISPTEKIMVDMINLIAFELLEMKSKQAVVESNAKFVKALEGG